MGKVFAVSLHSIWELLWDKAETFWVAKDKAGILVLGALGTLSADTAAFCKIGVWQSS
jgi:hypothetical protein